MNDGVTRIVEGGCYHPGGDRRDGHRNLERKYIVLCIVLAVLAFIVAIYREW
jgi:hypothetical protein